MPFLIPSPSKILCMEWNAFGVAERLMRYVQIDTQSDPSSDSFPSTEKQKDLSRLLHQELLAIGLEDATIDANGYVMATIPATIEQEKLDALNKAIVALQIPNVNDATSASKFLTTYKSLLAKDLEIGNLINILANNVPQPAKIQEQRNVAIKIIKRIILEAGAGGPAVVAQRIIPVGAPATAPAPTTTAEITTTSLDQAENNATAIQDNPQVASAIASQIKALEIPGITDVASVAKFINDYMSVIGKMKEVKQLLALLKDVSDVTQSPAAAPTQAAVAASTAASAT